MSLVRFSMINRHDDKIALYRPDAKQSIILDIDALKTLLLEISKNHLEIMPNEVTGLGLSFGSMSRTTWEKVIRLGKKLKGELIE